MTRKKILLLVKCVKMFRFCSNAFKVCKKYKYKFKNGYQKRKIANLYAGFKFFDAGYYKKVSIKKPQAKTWRILTFFTFLHIFIKVF